MFNLILTAICSLFGLSIYELLFHKIPDWSHIVSAGFGMVVLILNFWLIIFIKV